MLYRIINSTLVQQFPGYVVAGGIVYTNALAEELALQSGDWYPLSVSPTPTFNEESEYLEKNYHLDGGTIVLDWIVRQKGENTDAEV